MEKQAGSAAGKLLPADLGGRLRIVHGTIIPDSAYPAESVLELARLPKGARLLPCSQIHFEAGQSASMTIKVGDSGNDARYFGAAAPGASETSISLNANRLGNYTLPEEDVIIASVGAAPLAQGKTIVFDLVYVMD